MQRRKFTREFKIEAARLITDRGVSVAQAARDLDVRENVLRKWVKSLAADPSQGFPGHGQMKPEQLEIERLRREVTKLKAERDILKRPRPTSRGKCDDVRLHREAPIDLAGGMAVRSARADPSVTGSLRNRVSARESALSNCFRDKFTDHSES